MVQSEERLATIRVNPGPGATIRVAPGTDVHYGFEGDDYRWLCPSDPAFELMLNTTPGAKPFAPGPTPNFWFAEAERLVKWLEGAGLAGEIVFSEPYDDSEDDPDAIY